MPKGDFLGEFEIYVMLALDRLGLEAYGVTIRQEITARTGREVAIGAVYATLARLEDEGARRPSSVAAAAGARRACADVLSPHRGRRACTRALDIDAGANDARLADAPRAIVMRPPVPPLRSDGSCAGISAPEHRAAMLADIDEEAAARAELQGHPRGAPLESAAGDRFNLFRYFWSGGRPQRHT